MEYLLGLSEVSIIIPLEMSYYNSWKCPQKLTPKIHKSSRILVEKNVHEFVESVQESSQFCSWEFAILVHWNSSTSTQGWKLAIINLVLSSHFINIAILKSYIKIIKLLSSFLTAGSIQNWVVIYVHYEGYGNIGCWVFKGGIQN